MEFFFVFFLQWTVLIKRITHSAKFTLTGSLLWIVYVHSIFGRLGVSLSHIVVHTCCIGSLLSLSFLHLRWLLNGVSFVNFSTICRREICGKNLLSRVFHLTVTSSNRCLKVMLCLVQTMLTATLTFGSPVTPLLFSGRDSVRHIVLFLGLNNGAIGLVLIDRQLFRALIIDWVGNAGHPDLV